VSIPQLVAFALQADGWWLRQDIIWAKPNPMPESVTDRCTKAHEYVFLLTKSTRYFYDAEAVKEANTEGSIKRFQKNQQISVKNRKHESDLSCAKNRAAKAKAFDQWLPNGRNRRSVWSISTKPYRGAHFATFPPDLVEPCILAGTSEEGCCPACGTPWERVVEKTDVPDTSAKGSRFDAGKTGSRDGGDRTQSGERYASRAIGWRPACTCGGSPVPCTVLEPFSGSGTTLAVAANLGRNAIGTELNEEYIGLAVERIRRELEQGLLF